MFKIAIPDLYSSGPTLDLWPSRWGRSSVALPQDVQEVRRRQMDLLVFLEDVSPSLVGTEGSWVQVSKPCRWSLSQELIRFYWVVAFRISEVDCGPAVHLKICVDCRPTVLHGENSGCFGVLAQLFHSSSKWSVFCGQEMWAWLCPDRCSFMVPWDTKPVLPTSRSQTNDAFDARLQQFQDTQASPLAFVRALVFNYLPPVSCQTF